MARDHEHEPIRGAKRARPLAPRRVAGNRCELAVRYDLAAWHGAERVGDRLLERRRPVEIEPDVAEDDVAAREEGLERPARPAAGNVGEWSLSTRSRCSSARIGRYRAGWGSCTPKGALHWDTARSEVVGEHDSVLDPDLADAPAGDIVPRLDHPHRRTDRRL